MKSVYTRRASKIFLWRVMLERLRMSLSSYDYLIITRRLDVDSYAAQ